MKIVVENLSEGEVIPYPLLLVKGRVDNLDLDAMKGNYDPFCCCCCFKGNCTYG